MRVVLLTEYSIEASVLDEHFGTEDAVTTRTGVSEISTVVCLHQY